MKTSAQADSKQRPSRNDDQRQHILDAASLLFIGKGFGGTNINDIAEAVGVSRTALYYYFRSKETILQALTEEVTEKAGLLARSVSSRDVLPARQALTELIVQHAGLILAHPLQFRVVERSETNLPAPYQAAAKAARRSVLADFVRVIQRGIDNGEFRPTQARVAAFSIIGMCNWCAWWFDVNKDLPADAVAQSIADFSVRGLAPESDFIVVNRDSDVPSKNAAARTLEDAVNQIKQALAVMDENLLQVHHPPSKS